ncbi:hypothetical protein [Geodermatophilus sp. URMC 64]
MTLLDRSTTPHSPARFEAAASQVLFLLRAGFTVLPVLFGVDKFTDVLADWSTYLAPQIDDLVPGTAHQAMLAVGVVEILAGLLVAVAPRIGAPVVALWLAGIIVDLLLLGGHADIALRDLGLLFGAVALTRLAWARSASSAVRS